MFKTAENQTTLDYMFFVKPVQLKLTPFIYKRPRVICDTKNLKVAYILD